MFDEAKRNVLVLFSGGDSPGMNAFLRGFVRVGLNRFGTVVLGVKDGYAGVVRVCRNISGGRLTVRELRASITARIGRCGLNLRGQDIVQFDHASVSGILGRGGIVLGSARCPELHDPDMRRQTVELLDDLNVGTVVVCGGDGSLQGARVLADESTLQVIGVPASIDNDVPETETALGVDTAVNNIVWAVERINDTAGSHHRIMLLETMGRNSGELARQAAVASGAEIVVIPEQGILTEVKMSGIAERLEMSMHRGRGHGIVLVAEGVRTDPQLITGPTHALGTYLKRHFGRLTSLFPSTEIRGGVLGHLQRGGPPTAFDRILASQFAEKAWECISEAGRSGVLAVSNGRIGMAEFYDSQTQTKNSCGENLYALQKVLSNW